MILSILVSVLTLYTTANFTAPNPISIKFLQTACAAKLFLWTNKWPEGPADQYLPQDLLQKAERESEE